MTPENLDAGLEILGKYLHGVTLRQEGSHLVTNVLCELVSVADQQAIIALGWTGIDDRIGCVITDEDRKDKRMRHRLSCRVCDLVGSAQCPSYQKLRGQ